MPVGVSPPFQLATIKITGDIPTGSIASSYDSIATLELNDTTVNKNNQTDITTLYGALIGECDVSSELSLVDITTKFSINSANITIDNFDQTELPITDVLYDESI